MLLWQAMVVVVVDQGHNSWALPLILETRESGNLHKDLNGTSVLKTWFRIYLKLWQCMQLCWAKYGKGCFPFKICFFLLWSLLLNILLPRGTEILGKHLSKWGIFCKSPIWEQWVGGWDCNICSSWSIPSGHDPLCRKNECSRKIKSKI